METGYNEVVRVALYRNGLNNQIKDALASIIHLPESFKEFSRLVTNLDNRQFYRKMEQNRRQNYSSGFQKNIPTDGHTAMEIDNISLQNQNKPRGPLTKEEKKNRIANGKCLYCGTKGYKAKNCNTTSTLNFDVLSCPAYDVILGIPWLEKANPEINWKTRELIIRTHKNIEFSNNLESHSFLKPTNSTSSLVECKSAVNIGKPRLVNFTELKSSLIHRAGDGSLYNTANIHDTTTSKPKYEQTSEIIFETP
ncbi:hypothetical protein BB561_004406 [Smittium simulii]|uniref:CCHC-type domain-containing protein n=1 Tax=Smittium simulii TaxID=133385 RepID=A0A2T9YGF1_9FUNG|nr:hypothetical protein BB561_004406 [Smittium simulii]